MTPAAGQPSRHMGYRDTLSPGRTAAPSFISTPQTIADGTDHVDPAGLRGPARFL